MSSTQTKPIARDLEKAGAILASAAVKLGRLGHVKAGEVERLRSRLNTIILNLQNHERPRTQTRS